MRKIATTLALISSSFIASAQQVRPVSSDKIYHEIRQLNQLVNVLYVAAHPDDENTRLLAWLVNDRHMRTAYLSLTRGDGGQNILGSEQGDALGLIRTHELMEARKIDGAEQYFSRAIDFGFSKTFDETFKHWNKDTLTGDAVWVMRKFRPDVVICRFPPDSRAGHGQHAASAIIAAEAFKATGDKTRYADQLKYYSEWQPKRILFNAYRFGSFSTVSDSMYKIQVGQYEPVMGMGVSELAGQSRSVHKSQGAGTPSTPGIQTEYFRLVDGAPFTASMFDGIDTTWNRVGRKDIGEDLDRIIASFSFLHPDASIPALLAVRKKILSVDDEYWRMEKLDEVNRVILHCSGFMAEIYAKQPQAVAGEQLAFTLRVIARSATEVSLRSINWHTEDTMLNIPISMDTLFTLEHKITIPADAPVTEPYWLSAPHTPGLFTIPDVLPYRQPPVANETSTTLNGPSEQERILSSIPLGLPETPVMLNAILGLSIGGELFTVPVPLSYKKLDPVKGDVVEQLRIVPGASVGYNSGLVIVDAGGDMHTDIRIHAFKDITNAKFVGSIAGAKNNLVTVQGITLKTNADTTITLHASATSLPAGDNLHLDGRLEADNFYRLSQHLIQYDHIPTLQYFTQSSVKVVRANWQCTAKRIGYIEGAGDNVPAVLRMAGLQVDILKEADLAHAENLKKYDAIITGIRAVNVEKRMAYWLPVLFEYANNGGTLIMQYNTEQDLATTKLGPYPFFLSRDRVTEEDAKVDFIDAKARLLNYPNKITQEDFKDWVQERGLYFTTKQDPKYKQIFSMHDAGEQPLTGSTIYAQVGKGHYIYTTLSFSRQLPAGNKGAIRLFMNMLSVGK